MKRREYLTGVAGVGALATVGQMGAVAASSRTIGAIPDGTGDDYGPGTYTYPTSDQIADGAYDLSGVTITDEGDAWGFEFDVAGSVENPWSYDAGFCVQALQIYVQDPDAGDAPSSTTGRKGMIAGFAEPYHYRVHVTGKGQVVEDASAAAPADATVISEEVSASGNADANTITVTVPKGALGGGNIEDKNVAMLLFSHDGYGPGGIRTGVKGEAQQWKYGGIEGELLNAPRVLDMIDPDGMVDQQSALSYSADATASIPLFNVGDALESASGGNEGSSDFSLPATAVDPVDDDYGPGTYTYPTSDQIADGAYDIGEVSLTNDGDVLTFEVGVAGSVENPWSYDAGFCVQALQLYVQDPDAGGAPSSTTGRKGMIAGFAEPYHYRVHVTGKGQVVEDASAAAPADATVISEDVTASADQEANTISFSVPASAIGGAENLGEKKFALLLFSHDGYGPGGIRTGVKGEAQQWKYGGIEGELLNAPRVLDMLNPEGTVDQQSALSYSADATASIPLIRVSDAFETGSTLDSDGDGVPDANDYKPNDPDVQDAPAGPEGSISETVPGGEGPPTNLDRDGFVEDVDGDGDSDIHDVRLLAKERNSEVVQENAAYFDYNNDGTFGLNDIVTLFKQSLK